jgi:hypothetical protein
MAELGREQPRRAPREKEASPGKTAVKLELGIFDEPKFGSSAGTDGPTSPVV